jgi:hypothetical protein
MAGLLPFTTLVDPFSLAERFISAVFGIRLAVRTRGCFATTFDLDAPAKLAS